MELLLVENLYNLLIYRLVLVEEMTLVIIQILMVLVVQHQSVGTMKTHGLIRKMVYGPMVM